MKFRDSWTGLGGSTRRFHHEHTLDCHERGDETGCTPRKWYVKRKVPVWCVLDGSETESTDFEGEMERIGEPHRYRAKLIIANDNYPEEYALAA